jgi:hypothetical protein
VVNRSDVGLRVRGNLRLIDSLIEATGMQHSKYIGTPCVRYSVSQVEASPFLEPEEITPYRSAVGSQMHIAHDRPDLQFSVKESARQMQHPRRIDQWRIKRTTRYLRHHRNLEWIFELQQVPSEFVTSTDADWAGDLVTMRSTSGTIVRLGECILHTFSRTQGSVSLSSAEAEYISLCRTGDDVAPVGCEGTEL